MQSINRDPVQVARDESPRKQIIISADSDLTFSAVDVDDVERRARGHAQSLALAHRKVVDAPMMSQHLAICGDEFAGSVRQLLTLLIEVSIDEALVVTARNKAYLLRVGLFRQSQMMLARQLAHLRLVHVSQRKQRAAELLLRKSEQKIRLVLGRIGGAAQQPAITCRIEFAARVMPCGQHVGANLPSGNQQLIKLKMVIA